VRELDYQCEVLDRMGLDQDSVMMSVPPHLGCSDLIVAEVSIWAVSTETSLLL